MTYVEVRTKSGPVQRILCGNPDRMAMEINMNLGMDKYVAEVVHSETELKTGYL